MLRDILMIVMALGGIGMIVIFTYGAHKYGEVLREERKARAAALASAGETLPSDFALGRQRLGEISPGLRIYVVANLLLTPLAVLALVLGLATDSHAAIVTGAVLIGLWLIDTALVMPVVLARANRAERRRAQDA
jgi:hypothetical protein